ncbi:MAG: amino acid ABC transporter substrate-binding protein [Acidimicrobiales bacterium]|jgi:general L-amino acid transport system substrate-binding protein|nr:MAG: hypothetical protein MB52_00585 [marine actinobacterium MedAcidi-G1]|tara:strand:- start:1834 stop:2946 length:1113 start_codon:yes stop_codon:yes gene_type:complete
MTSKFVKLLAVALAIGVVAAACGSDEEEAPAAAPATTAAAVATTAQVEMVADGSLLDTVQARGTLHCGVSGSAVAFSETQADGSVTGFDADYCRAVAAAVLGDANAVKFTSLTASERFTAVQSGDVDVLIRNTTWTQSRDTDVGMDFGPTTYYDGQQLMGRASDGFTANSGAADLEGAVVCTNAGTTTEKNVSEYASLAGVNITLKTFETSDEYWQGFIDGACDISTTDGSALVGRKVKQQPADEEWVIFPATPISKEPLGPTYGQNDSKWADAVNWTVYATIIADEYGVDQSNVDSAVKEGELGRLLGGDGELQTTMGLSADAFHQVIKQVGNYSDIYNRNLNPVGLYREGSANAGWKDGGLIYAPPAR